ncbi:hypothetical protein UFOVP577_5 [uncultured Caudovirales phage]|uniref:Uncharacterized protein n=1 Tax=uncultured Caudovirales phage TaxID=2100421 RepID=A0A6J5MZQ0_9CAUD|nr:hypothetical protein UFOVP577_5 [uncultured Caudovirales phage]
MGHLALADSLAFLDIADRVHPASLVFQAIPVLMASRKVALVVTADSQDCQDFQASADILAAAYLAIPAAAYRDTLGTLALACLATAAIRAKAAFLDLAEFLDLAANRATAVNRAFLVILGLVYQDIAVLGFLATVAYLVTAALVFPATVDCLDTAVAAYLATLAAAYPVTAEHPATVAMVYRDILGFLDTQDQGSAAIQADLDTVV